MNLSVSFDATGAVVSREGTLYSVGLCSGSDAATLVLKSGGSSGTVLCKLAVSGANMHAERTFAGGVPFSNSLYAIVTGTTPQCDVEV